MGFHNSNRLLIDNSVRSRHFRWVANAIYGKSTASIEVSLAIQRTSIIFIGSALGVPWKWMISTQFSLQFFGNQRFQVKLHWEFNGHRWYSLTFRWKCSESRRFPLKFHWNSSEIHGFKWNLTGNSRDVDDIHWLFPGNPIRVDDFHSILTESLRKSMVFTYSSMPIDGSLQFSWKFYWKSWGFRAFHLICIAN